MTSTVFLFVTATKTHKVCFCLLNKREGIAMVVFLLSIIIRKYVIFFLCLFQQQKTSKASVFFAHNNRWLHIRNTIFAVIYR